MLLLPLTFLSSPQEGLLFPWRRIWCWYFLCLSLCSPYFSIYLANFVTCLSFIYSACDKKSQIYSFHLYCFPGSRSNYSKTSQVVSWSLVFLVSKPVSRNKFYFLKIILSTLFTWSLIIISHCLTESWSLLPPLILVKMHVSEVPLLSWWSFIHSTPSILILSFNLASLNISFKKTFLISQACVMYFLCTPVFPCSYGFLSIGFITLKLFQLQYIISSLRVRAVSYSPMYGTELTRSEC